MRGIIYKYTSPSGKVYIGQTNQESKRKYRFYNINQSYGSPKIDNARRKYNPDSFKYEVLFECNLDSKEELYKILGEKEVLYIKEFDSINNGYNHQEGGIYKPNIISKESRRRGDLKKSKVILQYTLEGKFIKEWLSTMDIERELHITHSLISHNCSGRTSHCREYLFRYKIEEEIPEYISVDKNIKINKTKNLSICQMNLEKYEVNRWKSISSAARDLCIDRHKLKNIAEKEEIYNGFIYKLI